MLWMNLSVAYIIHSRNKFVAGVKIKASGELKLNDSSGYLLVRWVHFKPSGTLRSFLEIVLPSDQTFFKTWRS